MNNIIGIGVDLIDLSRIDTKLAKRFLTTKEFDLFNNLTGKRALEFLGGRLAAKEAVFKALPENNFHFTELEILYDENCKPICQFKDYIIHISITHEKNTALAFAIVTKTTL